jgi:putative sterol carrier protein
MFKKMGLVILGAVSAGLLSTSATAVEFMDAVWAKQACDAWNKDAVLTEKLAQMPEDMFGSEGYKWIKNDAGRGYKIITMSRDGCKAPRVQLNIAEKNGKAMCIYGGKLDGKKLNMTVDYYMHATDADWTCMGSGKCGVMGSMMTNKLKFSGPKLEAMKVMDPFASFLKLTGKVAATKTACK